MPLLRAVVDTNVVFEGLTQQGGAAGLVMRAWQNGLFRACICDTLVYEYEAVLSRKLSATRWQRLRPVLVELVARAELAQIYFSWRPVAADPNDDHVMNCAINSRAALVTSNVKDFRLAARRFHVTVATPAVWSTYLVRASAP